jgi:DNA-binding transcriptional LysR family regulator
VRIGTQATLTGFMVELRHLRYFVAVAEELNFSRAAERLHMAQPPLSVAIRQLEQEIGTELLLRTTREVRLTGAGAALLDGARRTLTALDLAVSNARRAAAGEVGRLRVAFSWSERFDTLPAIGRALRESRPDVTMLTEEMWNARMAQALRSGAIDLAVALCPEVAADLSYATIRREPVIALLAADHALAGAGEIDLASLAHEGFVVFPREIAPHLYDVFIGVCRQAGFEPAVRDESFHTGFDLQILAELSVVALVPQSVAGGLPDGIVAVTLADVEQQLETAIVWRSDDDSAVAAALRDVAVGLFADP